MNFGPKIFFIKFPGKFEPIKNFSEQILIHKFFLKTFRGCFLFQQKLFKNISNTQSILSCSTFSLTPSRRSLRIHRQYRALLQFVMEMPKK